MFKIVRVENAEHWKRFLNLPGSIYQGDPLWTPMPLESQKQMFNPQSNPVLRHVRYECFIALQDKKTVGRIIAATDDLLKDNRVGLFGGFECINHPEVTRGLFEAASQSLFSRGKTIIQGPATMNTSQQVGLLVEGFRLPPQMMMPYNPSYYKTLLEGNGFYPLLDLYSYQWRQEEAVNQHKLFAVAKRAARIPGIKLRPINLKDTWGEGKKLAELHNQTMTQQWGYVPMEQEEAAYYLAGLRGYTDPELLFFCEVDNIPVGVCLMTPDLGPKIRASRRYGFPRPFGEPKSLRVGVLGVAPDYRRRGVAALLIEKAMKIGIRKGYQRAELSLIMESNTNMNQIITTAVGSRVNKRFRIYEKVIDV
ncbi:GNAT family N-acetyltransferase [Desulfotomaculum sp. 1211_IL3151]|uniref:GNAT family N-acetyltransferase n=1 Tax=Desulfotomaculum sp. 1211_IL3151 TaxID=3084055 RepID=UPI002FDB2F17